MKKVIILGAAGFIGRALSVHLKEKGFEIYGVDNYSRKDSVKEVGSQSVVEVEDTIMIPYLDIAKDYEELLTLFKDIKPDAIVHLAEQPSAPFSMIDQKHSIDTMHNNIIGTINVLWAMREACPDAHLVKLGTEGEYPDWIWNGKHIPEGHKMEVGFAEDWNKGGEIKKMESWEIPVPRSFGSWYHATKMYDSYSIEYACRIWGLTCTDVNQGVVYGHRHGTRLDIDECFGTVVHRFVAQAVIGEPLSVFGTGGQTRGFICLQNSIEAIELLINNPAKKGEFRVIHQTAYEYSVKEIAEKVQELTGCEIEYIDNPRVEMAENEFTFDTKTLTDLGLNKITLDDELPRLIKVMEENKDRIIKEAITVKTKWN